MTPQEIMIELKRRKEMITCYDNETAELCFKAIKEHSDEIEKYRAALILSGIIIKGLGKRTQEFLKDNPALPKRVKELLNGSILRMECY